MKLKYEFSLILLTNGVGVCFNISTQLSTCKCKIQFTIPTWHQAGPILVWFVGKHQNICQSCLETIKIMMIGTPSDFHDRRLSPKKYRATHSSHYHLNICLILLMHVLLLLPPQYTFLCLVSRDGGDGRLVVGCVFSEDLRAQRNFSEVLTDTCFLYFIPVDFFRGVVSPIIMKIFRSDQNLSWCKKVSA